MSRQPTQPEEKPKRPLIPMKDVDIYVRSGDPPATINLNDIGFYDDVSHYDIGGDSDDEICRYDELDDCEDWQGCAIPKECLDCGTYGEHWTGDADCPTKSPKHQHQHQHQEKPDSYQHSGRPLMSP
ncbi:hypothetical protein M0R45_012795 [Rubus argutus]|uniref:Uncharacterized protein n=1 Tax=Rubus argutus TaxID=59490 RepID=A0AAW1XGX5_RUBAR